MTGLHEDRARQERVQVDGVLLLDKPAGLTSNQALQKVKRLLRARKAGHTGSLDPAATGMLPLCFGEATKVCAYLLEADKTYRVTARLGLATDTGDADGVSIETAAVPELARESWERVLRSFLGWTEQVPPMYSALKQDGKRLYELARQGKVVERQPRPISVYAIDLLEAAGRRLVFRVRCSKGTYIRTLVEDIARRAGTVAYTQHLHRESVAGFEKVAMLDFDAMAVLAADGPEPLVAQLLPADRALSGYAAVTLDAMAARFFCQGRSVGDESNAPAGLVRVYGPGGKTDFLGVGTAGGDGTIAPKRVFATC
jgi:tRNA pseudouridine55 synthase